jgi:hypothetical protein
MAAPFFVVQSQLFRIHFHCASLCMLSFGQVQR